MNVEELLRSDAARVATAVEQVDTDALLRRIISATTASAPDDLEKNPDIEDCTPSADLRLSPLEEVRHHLRHALSSPSCARRAAELFFELLGMIRRQRSAGAVPPTAAIEMPRSTSPSSSLCHAARGGGTRP